MKQDTVFKKKFNEALDYVSSLALRSSIGSENRLATQFAISRTTVRKILSKLAAEGILFAEGAKYYVASHPEKVDYFPPTETTPTSDQVEHKFMEWMLRGDRKPGDYINGLELARQFSVSANAIREYLNRFSRFGLIEKRPNSGWVVRGFTANFALELFQIRELFETCSARAFSSLPPDAPAWESLATIEREHRALLADIEARYHDFSALDERFHRLLNNASKNRFFEGFYDIISLIFHYHFQWNKIDERDRNRSAIQEHLVYIEALFSRDLSRVEAACKHHLSSARKTLLLSIA